jgi:hypothetical protein
MNGMKTVTVVITACDRLDLLERTLRSFLAYNTYPITNFLIRDDSGLQDVWFQTADLMSGLRIPHFIFNPEQVGQARSIDMMMEMVQTPYVFHLEDDWEFDRPGFIEDCFEVMDDRTLQVRVRHRDDGSVTQTVPFNEKADLCTNHLWSFNPHLRKTEIVHQFEGFNETTLGELMGNSLGAQTLWLKEGACRHIGGEKTTNRPGTPYHSGVRKA